MADVQVIGKLVYEVTQVGLAQLKRQLEDLAATPLKVTPEVSQEGKRALGEVSDQIRTLRNRVTGLRNEFTAAGGDLNRYTSALRQAQREALELARRHEVGSRAFAHLTTTAAMAERAIVSAHRNATRAITPLDDASAALQQRILQLQNQVNGLRNLYTATGTATGEFVNRMQKLREEAIATAAGLDSTSREYRQLTTVAAQAERAIARAIRAPGLDSSPLRSQIIQLQNQVHGLRNEYIATGGSADQFAARMRQVRDEALQAARGLSQTSREFRQLMTVAAQAERAATQALGGISRLGLASQVRAGLGGLFAPGGVGRVMASGIGIMPGIVGQTAYFTSIFARELGRLNAVTGTAVASTLALGGAMAAGTVHAARLQQQQRLLEAITLQNTESYRELTLGILDLSTRVPLVTSALFEAAEEAAKLGVDGSRNILAFTEKIQGLAYVTRGDMGKLAAEVAKFMNELGIGPTSPDYIDALDGVANALAAVHTWSAATAEETIALSRYFAAIASQVGLTAPQIIALAGSLAALGGQAQSSGTNLAKFFLDMARAADQGGSKLAGMAEIAGMTVAEFRRLVRTDIVEAFLRIARGLAEAHGSSEAFARAMDRIGADNMRLIRVLGQAAVGLESFLTILEKVNEAQRERNYLDRVLSQATDNLIDQMRLLWNTLSAVLALMGSPVVEQLTERVKALREDVDVLYQRFRSLTDEQLRAIVTAGELALGFVGVTMALAALNGIVSLVMSGFRTLAAIGAFVFSPTILWIAGIGAAVVMLRRGWEQNWFGIRDAATSAMESVREKWEALKTAIWGREFVLPGSQPGTTMTVQVGGIRGLSLPQLPIPDWGGAIDAARRQAEEAWERVRTFFGLDGAVATGEEGNQAARVAGRISVPTLPNLAEPDWGGVIDAALANAKKKWDEAKAWFSQLEAPSWPEVANFEWPEIPPFEWPEIQPFKWPNLSPPESLLEGIRRIKAEVDALNEALARITPPDWLSLVPPDQVSDQVKDVVGKAVERSAKEALESPQAQLTVNLGQKISQVLVGEKSVGEALLEAITENVGVSLATLAISMTPLRPGWKITLAGVTFALSLLADKGLEFENVEQWAARTRQAIVDLIQQAFRGSDEVQETAEEDRFGVRASLDEQIRKLGSDFLRSAEQVRLDPSITSAAEAAGLLVGQSISAAFFGAVGWTLTEGIQLLAASGRFMADVASAAAVVGREFARGFVGPFVEGVIEGFMEVPALIAQGWIEKIREALMKLGLPEDAAREIFPDIIFKPGPSPTYEDVMRDIGGQGEVPGFIIPESLRELLDAQRRQTEALLNEVLGTSEQASRAASDFGDAMDALLDAIAIAEGSTARVPYGVTDFADMGNRFRLARNQALFDQLVRERGLVEGTDEYYRAAAEVTVLHYWETFRELFPQYADKTFAELAPEIQALFIRHLGSGYAPVEAHPLNVNWIPNVLRALGLEGYQEGGIIPGTSGPDKFLAMVAPGEAIVPSRVVRGGWPAVLEWFRSHGVPGFQEGKPPLLGGQLQEAIQYARSLVSQAQIEAQSQALSDELKSAFSEAVALLGRTLEAGGRAIFGDEFYNQGRQLIADLIEAIGILTGRVQPRPTARLILPTEEPDEAAPEVVRTLWQRFFDWLRAGWNNILDEFQGLQFTWSDAANLATAALQSFAAAAQQSESILLQTVSSLARNIRFTPEGRFDLRSSLRGMIADSLTAIVGEIVNWFSISAERLQAQSYGYQRIGPGEDVLGIQQVFEDMRQAEENRRKLDQLYRDLARQHQIISERTIGGAAAGAAIGAAVGSIFGPLGALVGAALGAGTGAAASNQSAKKALEAQMTETKRSIEDLERRLDGYVQRLREALGLTANDFAQAVVRAFSAATFEDVTDGLGRTVAGFKTQLEDAINSVIRGALVQRFIADVVATPIQELADMVFQQIVEGAEPDMEAVRETIAEIQDRAQPFYEMLDRLGIAGSTAADALNRTAAALRNLPSGFRVALYRFRATEGIPSLGTGGRVAPVPGGQIVRLAERGEAEWVIPESRMRTLVAGGAGGGEIHFHFHGPVYGMSDFRRQVENALQAISERDSLRRYGNEVALQRGRR